MKFRSKPAREKAQDYIEQLIGDSLAANQFLLPPIRAIAARAGVSHATMATCLRRLEQEGRVHIRKQSGVALVPVKQLPAAQTVHRYFKASLSSRHTVVCQRIINDFILGDVSRTVQLPSNKQIAAHYAVGYRTAKKALDTLVNEGMLKKKGRHYTRASAIERRPFSRIVLITAHADLGLLAEYSPRANEFWRQLEYEELRSGITLDILDYPHYKARQSIEKDTAGFLVWTTAFDLQSLRTLLQHLSALHRPVAVLDELGKIDYKQLHLEFAHLPRMAFFSMAMSERAGRDVARYLITKSYKNAAFFTHTLNDPCYGPRYEGFRETFEDLSGGSCRVRLFEMTKENHIALEKSVLQNTEPYKDLHARLEAYNSAVRNLVGKTASPFFVSDTIRPVRALYWKATMAPLFARALKDPDVTAWVCCNDEMAYLALDFLLEQGIDVPNRVIVIGFDDRIESFARGLSSYSFNVPVLVAAMVEHILWFGRTGKQPITGIQEVKGRIVQRWSTNRR